jgi:Transposase IS116/IS110/IS902 family
MRRRLGPSPRGTVGAPRPPRGADQSIQAWHRDDGRRNRCEVPGRWFFKFWPVHAGWRPDVWNGQCAVPGVGPVVVLAYMIGVEDPIRFRKSSSVGAYFAMTPARYRSGEIDRAGRVSKCGDRMVRGPLFEAAKVSAWQFRAASRVAKLGTSAHRAYRNQECHPGGRTLAVLMWSNGASFRKQQKAVPVGTASMSARFFLMGRTCRRSNRPPRRFAGRRQHHLRHHATSRRHDRAADPASRRRLVRPADP